MNKTVWHRKVINGCMAILFLWMVMIQFNDPDPAFWVAVYGLVAAVSLIAMFDRFSSPLILVGLSVCLGGALYLAPSVVEWLLQNRLADIVNKMSPDQPYIEEARECIGLLIACVALVYLNAQARNAVPNID